ncbi:calmodulin-like protein 6 [Stylonychia lemnae]|uniref:Calmodulin-like protein 6 n=1 Tax=Stylonychia lemnae TaxID=5949 RepID=A0A078ATI6_STYLE|nr:calmodulin-like protein 6 [Stylonychia lemnae]|eukprot:CDW84173.1 calmodulin-like protein 6 [Stylonychia lemnae]
MQDKIKEMILVVRPTQGNGLIPLNELESILVQIGFDFLTNQLDEINQVLDQSDSGFFYQDDLVEYLYNNHTQDYTEEAKLKKAIQMFDYEGKGKIKYEEFEYFMMNFGESENHYMDEAKIQLLLECCKPLDANGNILIQTLVDNINLCWKRYKNPKKTLK